ncbi:hypothetical protein EYF80_003170 [Liparis tanakae]|uniref:Uncharacterized protein n=1 Tax=Liparis tanakae TaxID=230148 RepID=A0A4Z2J8I6_9TELE|nr:hypothetical protein EYF80_003170 [Liparis tanakae]
MNQVCKAATGVPFPSGSPLPDQPSGDASTGSDNCMHTSKQPCSAIRNREPFYQECPHVMGTENYQVSAACPQNPRKHCVCPPEGRMESLGLLPGAKPLEAIEAVSGLFAEAERLAIPEAGQQYLCCDAAERRVTASLGLQEGKDEQQADTGGEGRLLGLLEQTLPFEQGQGLLVSSPGPFPILLLLQGELPLRPPQATQSIETVLQEACVGIALIPTDGTQTLSELHWRANGTRARISPTLALPCTQLGSVTRMSPSWRKMVSSFTESHWDESTAPEPIALSSDSDAKGVEH